MRTIIFFTTKGCHLCESAEKLLLALMQTHDLILESVDISDSEALVERYGILIPVIKDKKTEKELHWPFEADDITNLFVTEND
jgi:thiol-disulfide isomerase/thioredoxin|tara:strand:- start:246 stop:494 length:249 start_codon:yes stop_codon:yes gene_type:complete